MVHRVTCRNKNKRTPICPSTSASAISGLQIGRFVVVRRLRASLVRLSLWRLAIARTADGTTNFTPPGFRFEPYRRQDCTLVAWYRAFTHLAREGRMTVTIGRRELLAALGGAAAWPLAARAQQPAMPVVGFLSGGTPRGYTFLVAAFREGLKEAGYVEGQNVAIEYRWAEEHNDRLPSLAADLVGRRVAVIAGTSAPAALAAKAATTTIPIVFEAGPDPIELGLVTSLNRPGGNVTGVSNFYALLVAKQFELLHEMVPNSTAIGVLVNPTSPNLAESTARDAQQAGRLLGKQTHILNASTEGQVDTAFAALARMRPDALLIGGDAFFTSRRAQLATLATRQGLPTIYNVREFATAGGLMSYGASLVDAYRQTGIYTGKILKGAKPAELPVMQPSKFELVINLTTAKALGLEIPATVLARADEVIE